MSRKEEIYKIELGEGTNGLFLPLPREIQNDLGLVPGEVMDVLVDGDYIKAKRFGDRVLFPKGAICKHGNPAPGIGLLYDLLYDHFRGKFSDRKSGKFWFAFFKSPGSLPNLNFNTVGLADDIAYEINSETRGQVETLYNKIKRDRSGFDKLILNLDLELTCEIYVKVLKDGPAIQNSYEWYHVGSIDCGDFCSKAIVDEITKTSIDYDIHAGDALSALRKRDSAYKSKKTYYEKNYIDGNMTRDFYSFIVVRFRVVGLDRLIGKTVDEFMAEITPVTEDLIRIIEWFE